MAKKILSLLKKAYIYLKLEKKDATTLQNGFIGYIKAISYYCFSFSIYTILILN